VADPLVAKSVYERLGAADKTLKYLEGQYHEVFNEPPDTRKQNLDALCDWLESHAARGAVDEKVARP
jgi:alpha-beta hydrolase superfamily lysophospholipase